jgi:hypothetical protein
LHGRAARDHFPTTTLRFALHDVTRYRGRKRPDALFERKLGIGSIEAPQPVEEAHEAGLGALGIRLVHDGERDDQAIEFRRLIACGWDRIGGRRRSAGERRQSGR